MFSVAFSGIVIAAVVGLLLGWFGFAVALAVWLGVCWWIAGAYPGTFT